MWCVFVVLCACMCVYVCAFVYVCVCLCVRVCKCGASMCVLVFVLFSHHTVQRARGHRSCHLCRVSCDSGHHNGRYPSGLSRSCCLSLMKLLNLFIIRSFSHQRLLLLLPLMIVCERKFAALFFIPCLTYFTHRFWPQSTYTRAELRCAGRTTPRHLSRRSMVHSAQFDVLFVSFLFSWLKSFFEMVFIMKATYVDYRVRPVIDRIRWF